MSMTKLVPVFCALFLLVSCTTKYSDGFKDRLVKTKEEDQKAWENFEKKLSPIPEDAIGQVRIFARENIPALDDDELDFIDNNPPKIEYDEMSMEYSFSWKFDRREILEVVTTPPPCKPIAAYRTSRVYYP